MSPLISLWILLPTEKNERRRGRRGGVCDITPFLRDYRYFFFIKKKIKSSLQLVEIVGLGGRGISWLDLL